MITFKLNLEDIRNIDGFCIHIQMVIGLPFWIQIPHPSPHLSLAHPFPSKLHSPTPHPPLGVVLNGRSSVWGSLPASPGLFSCIKGISCQAVPPPSPTLSQGTPTPPHSLTLACPPPLPHHTRHGCHGSCF
ncbi:unnamed protein product [Rangifer tarandus platyrhynchus]|uniref:Uncharacterized protein n=2 Tax=Rangifer tarandus platyrhynchus TaxID=3082113 RepID=A0AC59Y1S5_RANTA|nr:unnamed protein product [Rangifer tarandus platyrhynchus]